MTLILKFESKVRNGSILMMVTFDPIRLDFLVFVLAWGALLHFWIGIS